MTHLLYVFSDWGQHQLSRVIFSEEYEFICNSMTWAIQNKDSEIVGEFLQCLAALQVVCCCFAAVVLLLLFCCCCCCCFAVVVVAAAVCFFSFNETLFIL